MGRTIASEKTAELLFTRYFLQAMGLRTVTLLAPTTGQEFLDGYDAKISGAFCEIVLQFKSPKLIRRARKSNVLSIKIDDESKISSMILDILSQEFPQAA